MSKLPITRLLVWILAVAAVLLLAGTARAQQTKRLILKDGSYQPAVRWEIKGNRVRYLSAERFEWEEIPSSLVDWAATEKYSKALEAGEVTPQALEVDAEEQKERQAEEARRAEVAPGLRLPLQGGVVMMDTYRGQPQLVEVVQSGSEINAQRGKNVLRSVLIPIPDPRAVAKQTIELKGTHARVQAHVSQPVLYVSIDDQDQDPSTGGKPEEKPLPPEQRFRIIRAQEKRDSRVVGNLKIAITGKVSQQDSSLPTTVQPMAGAWVKVTPAKPLEPGEYALVEMLGKKEMNLYVWDFGVNPSAPENATSWKPVQSTPNKTGSTQSPVLNKRDQ